MDITNSFISTENKGLLWGLLFDNGIFDGIDQNKYTDVQTLFEKTVHDRSKTINQKEDLMTINKSLITSMIENIRVYKLSLNNNNNNIQTLPLPETIEKPAIHQRSITEQKFNAKEQEFNDMITLKRPEEISFTDNLDEPLEGDKLDTLLESAIRDRQADVDAIQSKQNVKNNNTDVKNDKHVEFSKELTTTKIFDTSDPSNFLNKLKVESSENNNTILPLLMEINTKLDLILDNINKPKANND